MLLDVLVRINKVAFMGRQKTCKLKPAPGALGVESSTSSFCQLFKFINISGLRSQWGGHGGDENQRAGWIGLERREVILKRRTERVEGRRPQKRCVSWRLVKRG